MLAGSTGPVNGPRPGRGATRVRRSRGRGDGPERVGVKGSYHRSSGRFCPCFRVPGVTTSSDGPYTEPVWWVAWLHVAALWAFAMAQPLFDLLGANPEFFVAHRAGSAEILLLTVVLAVVPPSLLTLGVWLIGLLGPRARTSALNVVLAGLASALAVQLAIRAGATTWPIAIPIALAAGAAVAVAYHRRATVRNFFTVLSIAALIFPSVFLLRPGTRRLVAGRVDSVASPVAPGAVRAASTTPVVLVVFDELPLLSLLDADRNLDSRLYPNFSALARDGVWFRNATTVSDLTRWAVPSIVSGQYPRQPALPSAIDHPNTLFTLLGATHRLEVSEPLTSLCPRTLCPADPDATLANRLAAMGRDLRVVLLHLILTDDLTEGLPDPTATWARLAGRDRPSEREATQRVRDRWREGITAERVTPIRQFIDRLGRDDPQPTLYFLHTLVTHHPYYMLPSGKQNATYVSAPGKVGFIWAKDQPWAVAQQYQHHLLQVGLADNLLGQLVTRLKDIGLYDRAIMVVTADHGISHTPGAPERTCIEQNAAEVLRVPLIMKFPDRVTVSPRVSDVNAETIDILPTIADALGIEVPWQVDGSSLLDPARLERASKAMFASATRTLESVDADGPDMGPALQRKIALFGDGTRNVHRAPRLPAVDWLIGQPLAELRVADGGGPLEITNAWAYDDVDLSAPAVVFDVAGRFASPRPDTFVAVAVNGVVEAVTRTWESNARGWLATPRFDAWRQGRNAIDVLVIDRDEAGLLLRRTALKQVRPADLNLILDAAADDWGVRQWGFYPVEGSAGGSPFRWTRDRAELSNLVTHHPPREVRVDVVMVPGGTPKALTIKANDCTLFDGQVRDGWSSTLSLERCDTPREGLILRFATPAPRGAVDRRRLGVALSRVVLR